MRDLARGPGATMMPGPVEPGKAAAFGPGVGFQRHTPPGSFVGMNSSMWRMARYGRAWIRRPTDFDEEEVGLDRNGTRVPATVIRPRAHRATLPAWVVLHGLTRRGRQHAQLVRFTRALVSTGAVAIVPEVPEWRDLRLDPKLAAPTIRAAIDGLRDTGWARDARVGLFGFSFGAPHTVAATADPTVRDRVAGSVAFGGYCDVGRTFRFMMTGRHEWLGRESHLDPDPYGRWIVGSNYLTRIPEHSGATATAEGLRLLAARAGDLDIPSNDPLLDRERERLWTDMGPDDRELFELFAPPSGKPPDERRAAQMGQALAAASSACEPTLAPAVALASVELPVHILHGRRDILIPYSEGLRLREALPAETWSRATVTSLFAHASQDGLRSMLRGVVELPSFLRALGGALGVV